MSVERDVLLVLARGFSVVPIVKTVIEIHLDNEEKGNH